ncbi:MAG: hypothetical protein ACKOA8_16380, partial [Deltaproteobacteria bacterium]
LSSIAHSFDEVSLAIEQLDRAVYLIEGIQRPAEQLDKARLGFIKRNALMVKSSVQEKGLAHAATMRSYQQLIVAFRYSSSFLKQLATEYSGEAIKELVDIHEAIVKARGFDDTPYTQITANVFGEMYQLVKQLSTVSVLPAGLKPKLDALIPKIGNVIAIAKQGDRPKTFKAAVPLSQEITALYGDLGKVQHANSAFDIVLDIQGLNEFYAEFAQIEGLDKNP